MSFPSPINNLNDQFSSFSDLSQFVIHWTPRAVVAGLAGFYSLGVAYENGLMAAIDRVAIRILRHYVGYAGLGAIMPTFQWYSAWTVRLSAALLAGLAYDASERTARYAFNYFKSKDAPLHPLPPASTRTRTR